MLKTLWVGIPLFPAIAVFLILSGYGILQPARIDHLFITFSYYIIFGVFIAWILSAVRLYRQEKVPFTGLVLSNWKGLAICLLITLSLCSAVQPHFRVLDDETSLLSVSHSLAREHRARGVTQAKYSLGRDYIVLEQYVPKRPLLFPFLVHLTHLIHGPHWNNGFILNAILLFACLVLVYLAVRHQLDEWGAMAAVLLILTNPVFIISARSSGFDFLSTSFFLLSLVSVHIFLRNPNSASFGFLLSTLLMFVHIRYENIYLFVLVPVFIATVGAYKKEFIRHNLQLVAWTPTLLLPYFWQMYLSRSFIGDGVVSKAFTYDYLSTNTKTFIASQTNLSSLFDTVLSDWAVPIAALLGLYMLYLAIRRVLNFSNDANRRFFTLSGVAVGVHLLILLYLYLGDITLTYMQRIYLPVFSLLVLTPLLIPWLLKPWINTRQIFVIALILFILYLPVSLYPQRSGLFYPDLEYQMDFLRSYNPRTTLVVTGRPIRLTALGFGAVSFEYMNTHKDSFIQDMRNHSFTDVLAFQILENMTESAKDNEQIAAEFSTEPITTFRTAPHQRMRVSRVTAALTQ